MRYLFFISFFISTDLLAQITVYTSDDYVLQLQSDSTFIFYPKEISLKTSVAGDVLLRNDSLILSTHQWKGEKAIFAIYHFDSLQLDLLHFQKEFALSLPQNLYIHKSFYADGSLQEEYRWINKKQGEYDLYTFSDELNLLSMEHFSAYQYDGRQYYYFDNPFVVLSRELNYKAGELHGTSYFFEALDDDFLQVELVQKKKYKNGKLKQTKMPAIPPVFYTSHF